MRIRVHSPMTDHTLARTAMEAYELPKFMPTIGGMRDAFARGSALPFGIEPFAGILQD